MLLGHRGGVGGNSRQLAPQEVVGREDEVPCGTRFLTRR